MTKPTTRIQQTRTGNSCFMGLGLGSLAFLCALTGETETLAQGFQATVPPTGNSRPADFRPVPRSSVLAPDSDSTLPPFPLLNPIPVDRVSYQPNSLLLNEPSILASLPLPKANQPQVTSDDLQQTNSRDSVVEFTPAVLVGKNADFGSTRQPFSQLGSNPPASGGDASEQSYDGWSLKRVEELALATNPTLDRPDNLAEVLLRSVPNGTMFQMVDAGAATTWIAPDITYQPLLFEDARLERHGYASPYFAVQPIRSGFHFTNSSLLLPFRAWFHRNQMESPLAFERPGSYAAPSREVFVPAFSPR